MQRGDVFLVCDAGGGTTDLNVLKVMSASKGRTELEPLHCNEGEAIGSTLNDHRAERMILERLQKVQADLRGLDLESVARRMVQDRFMSYKCSFGSSVMNVPKLPLPIPDIGPGQDFPVAGIENSNLVFSREDLRALFDEQVQRICDLLDEQLRLVQNSHPDEYISYLALSGGLGSSPYVQKRIRDRYERGAGPGCANAQNLTILLASDPCPASYGILCREPYDAIKHQEEDVEQDPYTGKRFAEKQVSWFIKQGDKVDVKHGVNQRFRYKIPLGREREPWRTRIVMSGMPITQLPRSLRHEGVKQVCTMETVLETHDMKRKNNKWYHLRREYNEAEFDVKLLVGTGLHFEIWGFEGRKSKSHEEIEVEWETADESDSKANGVPEGLGMYRVS